MTDAAPYTFGLDDVLKALRADLLNAEASATDDNFGLYVEEAEVELAFTLVQARGRKGGVNLRIFGVGAGGDLDSTRSDESVHRIRLILRPGPATSSPGEDDVQRPDSDPTKQVSKQRKRGPVAR
jgi:hypothetical protein